MSSERKHFAKFIRQYGLILKAGRSHSGIYKDGKRIYVMAGSPKNAYQAMDNNIKDLINCGHLPPGITYRGKTYKKKLL